jgi:putative hydrolase of the HAD superfamily
MWLLMDYGGVLCAHQSDQDLALLAGVAGTEFIAFKDAYWRYRAEYDRADLASEQYWAMVLGSRPHEAQLERLNALDLAGWSIPNEQTVQWCRQLEHEFDFALLSNAPTTLARAIEKLPWMPAMRHWFFSCDLRLTKPAREVYEVVVRRLAVRPGEIIFVDDRPENIEAADAFGMRTVLFSDAADLTAAEGLKARSIPTA